MVTKNRLKISVKKTEMAKKRWKINRLKFIKMADQDG